jgi:uncharacterized membrane protein (UPF0127 family)
MKPHRILPHLALVLAVAVAVIIMFPAPVTKDGQSTDSVCFLKPDGASCFIVEVARTPEEKERGLMGRESIGERNGMLFVFGQEGSYGFWMRNMTMAIDLIFIGEDKKVVFVKREAQPCTSDPCEMISPQQKFMYVLEIGAGISDLLGIEEGTDASISVR